MFAPGKTKHRAVIAVLLNANAPVDVCVCVGRSHALRADASSETGCWQRSRWMEAERRLAELKY